MQLVQQKEVWQQGKLGEKKYEKSKSSCNLNFRPASHSFEFNLRRNGYGSDLRLICWLSKNLFDKILDTKY